MTSRRWVPYGPPNYPFTLNRESNQAKGLVAWWPTVKNQGSIVRDFAQGNYCPFPGGANNPALLSTATRGRTLHYDGNDYITSTNNGPIVGDIPFSLACWANADLSGDAASLVWDSVAFQIGQHNGLSRSAYIAMNENRIRFEGWGVSAINYDPPSPINGIWKHIIATYEGGGAYNLYIDGMLFGSDSDVDAFDISVWTVQIGSGSGSGGDWRYFEGHLDDCRIYNRALTAIEVLDQYRNPWELYQPLHQPLGFVSAAAAVSQFWPSRRHPSKNVLLRL